MKKVLWCAIFFAILSFSNVSAMMSYEEWEAEWDAKIDVGDSYTESSDQDENNIYTKGSPAPTEGGFEEWKKWRKAQGDDYKPLDSLEVARQKQEASEKALQEELDGSLYKNKIYNFRIKFPENWEIEDGNGENVIKKAVDGGSSVIIMVGELEDFWKSLLSEQEKNLLSDEELNEEVRTFQLEDFSDEDLNLFLDEYVEGQVGLLPDSEILSKEIRYIDNRKALYLKIKQNYEVLDAQESGVTSRYVIFHNGKLFQISGTHSLVPDNEEYKESAIEASMASFIFEDREIQKSDQNSEDRFSSAVTSEPSPTDLLFAFLFTWVVGLIVPLIFRYIVLRRPLSKSISLLIVIFVFIGQLIISLVLSSQNKAHFALLLVAWAGYSILHSGYVADKKEKKKVVKREINPKFIEFKEKTQYRFFKATYIGGIAISFVVVFVLSLSKASGKYFWDDFFSTFLISVVVIILIFEILKRSFYYVLLGSISVYNKRNKR